MLYVYGKSCELSEIWLTVYLKSVSENLGFQNLVTLVWKKKIHIFNFERKKKSEQSQNAQSKEDRLLD